MHILLKFFSEHAPNRLFLSIFLGALSGIAYALIFPVLMTSFDTLSDGLNLVNDDVFQFYGVYVSSERFAALFFGLCIFTVSYTHLTLPTKA